VNSMGQTGDYGNVAMGERYFDFADALVALHETLSGKDLFTPGAHFEHRATLGVRRVENMRDVDSGWPKLVATADTGRSAPSISDPLLDVVYLRRGAFNLRGEPGGTAQPHGPVEAGGFVR
jgi:hypothetical protein